MATSKKRVTVNLSVENAEYVKGVAHSHGKTLSWAIEKIIEEYREGAFKLDRPGRQQPREDIHYDDDNPLIEKK